MRNRRHAGLYAGRKMPQMHRQNVQQSFEKAGHEADGPEMRREKAPWLLRCKAGYTPEKEKFSFDELKQYEFWFSSGAGAWATTLNINPDGSFYGEYSDSDMGSTGDGYPDGTLYWCDFSGQFTEPVRVNEYTYSMQIAEINYEQEAGSEEILDGRRYCYSDAYGLENTENILIYLPGAPLTELSEEFRIWIGYYDIEESGDKELPFYALNNEAQQYGFVGYDTVENLKDSLEFFSQEAAKIEDSIQNDPLTQLEYNEKTKELYDLLVQWDFPNLNKDDYFEMGFLICHQTIKPKECDGILSKPTEEDRSVLEQYWYDDNIEMNGVDPITIEQAKKDVDEFLKSNIKADIQEVSINSPVGKAIYGKKIGELCSYSVNNRNMSLLIKSKVDVSMGLESKKKTLKN